MKMLYDLEYKVGQLREQYIDKVKYDELTLKEVLDLGFNNVIIKDYKFYKDHEDDYIVGTGFIFKNDELLNSKVKFVSFNIIDEELADYLTINVEFVNKEMYSKLLKYTEELDRKRIKLT